MRLSYLLILFAAGALLLACNNTEKERLFLTSDGILVSPTLEQLRTSCEDDSFESCNTIARLYMGGSEEVDDYSIVPDEIKGSEYYSKACELNDGDSCYSYAVNLLLAKSEPDKGSEEDKKIALKRAFAVLSENCKNDDPVACSTLGDLIDSNPFYLFSGEDHTSYYKKAQLIKSLEIEKYPERCEKGALGACLTIAAMASNTEKIKNIVDRMVNNCLNEDFEHCDTARAILLGEVFYDPDMVSKIDQSMCENGFSQACIRAERNSGKQSTETSQPALPSKDNVVVKKLNKRSAFKLLKLEATGEEVVRYTPCQPEEQHKFWKMDDMINQHPCYARELRPAYAKLLSVDFPILEKKSLQYVLRQPVIGDRRQTLKYFDLNKNGVVQTGGEKFISVDNQTGEIAISIYKYAPKKVLGIRRKSESNSVQAGCDAMIDFTYERFNFAPWGKQYLTDIKETKDIYEACLISGDGGWSIR